MAQAGAQLLPEEAQSAAPAGRRTASVRRHTVAFVPDRAGTLGPLTNGSTLPGCPRSSDRFETFERAPSADRQRVGSLPHWTRSAALPAADSGQPAARQVRFLTRCDRDQTLPTLPGRPYLESPTSALAAEGDSNMNRQNERTQPICRDLSF